MESIKDTRRAQVRIAYDGTVYKTFRGHQAELRFANEVKVLQHLEARGCPFVPKVVRFSEEELLLVTTNCGQRVESIGLEKMGLLHDELRSYGVEHGDWDKRNITYSQKLGRFCVIDFEFATIWEDPNHRSPVPMPVG